MIFTSMCQRTSSGHADMADAVVTSVHAVQHREPEPEPEFVIAEASIHGILWKRNPKYLKKINVLRFEVEHVK